MKRKKTKKPIHGPQLLEQYVRYFNKRRNAGIEIIGIASTADPTNREIRVRYEDVRDDVSLPDVLSWTQLFDKLSEMHPKNYDKA